MRKLFESIVKGEDFKLKGFVPIVFAIYIEAFYQKRIPDFIQSENQKQRAKKKLLLSFKDVFLDLVQKRCFAPDEKEIDADTINEIFDLSS